MRAFQKDFRPVETEFEKEKKIQTQKKLRRIDKIEEQKAEQRTLKKQFETERKQKVKAYLKTLDANRVEELKQEYISLNAAHDRMKTLLKSKGFDNPAIQNLRHKFIAENHLAEKRHSLESYLAISSVEVLNGETST